MTIAVDLGRKATKQTKKQITADRILLTLSPSASSDNFCKQFDPEQARQNGKPDLDPICLTLKWYF